MSWRRADAALALLIVAGALACAPGADPGGIGTAAAAHADLVDLSALDPRIRLDLRYATADNFTGQVLYEAPIALLRRPVAERLRRVADRLDAEGLTLVVYDAYRPLSVQHRLWALVPDPDYVADPAKGSRHNRGAAVDVGLASKDGSLLPMPSGYDAFGPEAHRDYAGGSAAQRANRERLARAMEAEGFVGLATEWWHFDAPDWERYGLLDVPLR